MQEMYSTQPLRDCESESPGTFKTNCDWEEYLDSLPLCGKGHKLNITCVTPSQSSKVCVSCEPGHFQAYDNHCGNCHSCSDCGSLRTVQPCNAEQDTVCEDPKDVTDSDSRLSTGLSTTEESSSVSPGLNPEATTPGLTHGPTPEAAIPEATHEVSSGVSRSTSSTIPEVLPAVTTIGPNRDLSTQNGNHKEMIALVVLVVILTISLVMALIGCVYYRQKYIEIKRGTRHNGPDRDVELQACNGVDFIPGPLERAPPPATPIDRPDGRYHQFNYPGGGAGGAAGGEHNGQCPPSPHQEPVYATVNKQGKSSKATMTDNLQRPSTSSGNTGKKNVVCKTIRKVCKGNSKGARKKTGPGSEVEKGQLLKSKNPDSPPSVIRKTPSLPTTLYPHHKQAVTSQTQPALSSQPQSSQPSTTVSLPQQLPQSSSQPLPSSPSSFLPLAPSQSWSPLPSSSKPSSSSPSSLPPPIPQTSTSSPTISTSPPSSSSLPPSSPPPQPSPLPQQPPSSSLPPLSSLPPSTSLPSSQVPSPAMPPSLSLSPASPSTSSKPTPSSSSSPPPPSSSPPPSSGPTPSSDTPSSMPSRDEVEQKNKEKSKSPFINPDEVVSETFLDRVTDVISLTTVERVARTCGLPQVEIDNLKVSSRSCPKDNGFHILCAVLKLLGCSLTYERLLKAIKTCKNKDAADTLIREYSINMTFDETR
ncbi:mucin-2-like isoform X2 [Lytechinus pictus]|uniref:mucin-2-like isoform X2 n=1 Tax=Lytechinus pictus TaxID=7653 RepID=UPI0030B9CA6E